MSYTKARDLLRLADFATSRYRGVTLQDIKEEFEVSHRTAQRMTDALESAFPNAVDIHEDTDRKKHWSVRETPLARLCMHGDMELEALDYAIARLEENGDKRQKEALSGLRDRLMAALPSKDARRIEADAEAMLEAYGVAARPGPVTAVSVAVSQAVANAIRGPYLLSFSYNDKARLVESYGVLLGARRYLVAKQVGEDKLRHYRFDRIETPEVIEEFFHRDPDFDLNTHASRAFGSFQSDEEFGLVVWRFTPETADRAAEWRFHPNQQVRHCEDGTLEVSFEASGLLEMAWHLYQWGDAVEVVSPKALAKKVSQFRRGDFDALP